ncbi:protein CONTINUOUS VASCULAR RING 1-like protein [Cinnamomum micranthum f. kanehirae]|uniref:Protein CONTINUOUS VASCULAR RING 1-like protein n=1 Tax=Cinnamomum micranthum f. kanehirae TaxID=337451 RepID=A0A443Q448_9MAGN|nr:protein CONTINUOUS VASCULAR RING 1-like protein [Cinnamomum micranthum f. kanehirae]
MSSWLGASILALGEWVIKRMPFVRHMAFSIIETNQLCHIMLDIHVINALLNYADQSTQAFKEVAIIRHPRIGEYAFGFITASVLLQNYSSEEELYCVSVPTNHLYIGDVFLINSKDVIRPDLSVREGIVCMRRNWLGKNRCFSSNSVSGARMDSSPLEQTWQLVKGIMVSLVFPRKGKAAFK